MLAAASAPAPAIAAQQDNVDYVVARIRTTLAESLQTDDWPAKYRVATMNIEDLQKTLAYGGEIRANPVAEFSDQLAALMGERRETLSFLIAMLERAQRLRGTQARQTLNDIGGELIRRLTPRPGILTAVTSFGTHNENVIREDFAYLRSFDEAIEKIQRHIESIRPAIHDLERRTYALRPLLAAYAALRPASPEPAAPGSSAADGTYDGEMSSGNLRIIDCIGCGFPTTFRWTVLHGRISGSASTTVVERWSDGVTRTWKIEGTFTGRVESGGKVTATIQGRSEYGPKRSHEPAMQRTIDRDDNFVLRNYTFRAELAGTIVDRAGSGTIFIHRTPSTPPVRNLRPGMSSPWSGNWKVKKVRN
jgi:hypothetical protein